MRFLIILLCASVFFVGCEKNDMKIESTSHSNTNLTENGDVLLTLSNVIEKEGRLIFENQEAVDKNLNLLFEHQDDLSFIKKQFPTFKSSRSAFNDLTETDIKDGIDAFSRFTTLIEYEGEMYVEPVIDADLIADIVNEDGIIQVGEDIYGFHYDVVYKFKEKDISDYLNDNLRGFEQLPIKREVTNFRTVIFDCETLYTFSSEVRKVRGEIKFIGTPLGAQIVGVASNHNQVGTFWFRKKARRLKMAGEVTADRSWLSGNNLIPVTVDLFKAKRNESRMSKVGITAPPSFFFTNFRSPDMEYIAHTSSSTHTCVIN